MTIVIIKDLKCDTRKSKVCLFERHSPSPTPNTTILINIPQLAPQPQGACGFKCLHSAEEFRSMWSQRPLVFSSVSSPLVHTETAKCLIRPVAPSSFIVQIQLKLSVQLLQFHGLTESITLTGTVLPSVLSHATGGDWPLPKYLR